MLWNPRLFSRAQRNATVGGQVDVNPTIADVLGVEADGAWQGHSLFDPAKPNRVMLMAIGGGDIFGMREDDWKYVYDATNGRESLFNLTLDPDEKRNVVRAEGGRAWDLRRRVAAWVSFEDAYLKGREK